MPKLLSLFALAALLAAGASAASATERVLLAPPSAAAASKAGASPPHRLEYLRQGELGWEVALGEGAKRVAYVIAANLYGDIEAGATAIAHPFAAVAHLRRAPSGEICSSMKRRGVDFARPRRSIAISSIQPRKGDADARLPQPHLCRT